MWICRALDRSVQLKCCGRAKMHGRVQRTEQTRNYCAKVKLDDAKEVRPWWRVKESDLGDLERLLHERRNEEMQEIQNYPTVDISEVILDWEEKKCLLVDLRSESEYQALRLEGSVRIQGSDLCKRFDELKRHLVQKGTKKVYLLDQCGYGAKRAAVMLRKSGEFTEYDFCVVEGGLLNWINVANEMVLLGDDYQSDAVRKAGELLNQRVDSNASPPTTFIHKLWELLGYEPIEHEALLLDKKRGEIVENPHRIDGFHPDLKKKLLLLQKHVNVVE
ncbi:uncharacterized protein LOC126320752 [Schistocerca gregaria]|uniref:uncharacterized protein LOC126320752 n=1 Tax=Schistocerca gregaria TaxID=7010 RepID=UPI00211EE436|nr:uncharacterized protein LOC126320752 [Schistocerca gregaria]